MKINKLVKGCSLNAYLYTLNLTLTQEWLKDFSGIKYVCMQGSPIRAKDFAKKLANRLMHIDTTFFEPINLTGTDSFHCYRVGDVLSISHGMGHTSILTLLHNISKIMYFAGNYDIEYIRIGTSGGIGIEPGSVILTETAYMPNLIPGFNIFPLGRGVIYPTGMNTKLNNRILAAQPKTLDFKVLTGNSIAAHDFYMGQARFDGLIKPRYDELERQKYFEQIQALNILNFEMESTALAAFCNRAEIPATMIAVTLLNRMLGDQVIVSPNVLAQYYDSSHTVVLNYLEKQIKH